MEDLNIKEIERIIHDNIDIHNSLVNLNQPKVASQNKSTSYNMVANFILIYGLKYAPYIRKLPVIRYFAAKIYESLSHKRVI